MLKLLDKKIAHYQYDHGLTTKTELFWSYKFLISHSSPKNNFQSAQTMFGPTLCFTMSVRPRHFKFWLEKDTFEVLLYNTFIVSKVSF